MDEVLDTDLNELDKVTRRGGRGSFEKVDAKLDTFQDAKAYYCKVINNYAGGRIPLNRARTLGYLLTGLLSFYKLAMEEEILERIQVLEEKIKDIRR